MKTFADKSSSKNSLTGSPGWMKPPPMTPGLQGKIQSMKGGGQLLTPSTRSFFEPRFGRDFGNVRVHTGSKAAEAAKSINAKAFTTGKDVVFGAGQYSRETSTGKQLLAHELTHVVQQKRSTPCTVMRVSPPQKQAPVFSYHKLMKDKKRGFRLQDLRKIPKLTFRGSLSPLPPNAQKILLANIEATVRFALEPKNLQRQSEVARLHKEFKRRHKGMPWYDRPAERADSTDLYHGHVKVPVNLISKKLRKLMSQKQSKPYISARSDPRSKAKTITINSEIKNVLTHLGPPLSIKQARQVMRVVGRHHKPFRRIMGQIIQELKSVPGAMVLYHTYESYRPRVGGQKLSTYHPIRSIVTPLSNNQPYFSNPSNKKYPTLINFSFHINRKGQITLFPHASYVVRAYEILHPY